MWLKQYLIVSVPMVLEVTPFLIVSESGITQRKEFLLTLSLLDSKLEFQLPLEF